MEIETPMGQTGSESWTSSDRTALELRRLYSAPRERVFRAWIERDALQKWLRPTGTGTELVVRRLDPSVGGGFEFEAKAADGTLTLISGTYLRIDFPEKLVFTWSSRITNYKETLVTIEFIERGEEENSTQVVLTHERFTAEGMRASHEKGWATLLERLAGAL